ncbi:MAG TPA: efflux RND transporter periplasmic adaptor subunit [Candidatus Limnocylindrales bacterium]|nr:efflux RND transporter periplasmic adaptor subunit [Candidatus Limnocylindrales bacterium]
MSVRESYQKHKRLTWLIVIIVAAILTIGAVMKSRATSIHYITMPVKRGSITAMVQSTGTINPLTTVPVGSFVSGTVQYIFADFNTKVHAGDVLAQLDPTFYDAQVTTARGNLANAVANVQNLQANIIADQANVAKLQANAEYARVNAKRIADLTQQGVISRDQNDQTQSNFVAATASVTQAEAQVNQAKAQLAQARAQVESAQGNLKMAETNLLYTTIVSPVDGTVIARNVTVGQSVAASLQAPNVFTIAQDLTRMQVYAATDESDTGQIHVGQLATFQVDAYPAQTFQGRVSAVRLDAFTVQNVVTYNTIIDFENPEGKLLPGETAYVTIPTGEAKNVLLVPNIALTFTPQLSGPQIQALYKKYNIPRQATVSHVGGWQLVWKLDVNQQPIPVAIKTGLTDYTSTDVVEGSLKQGDQVITGEQVTGGSGATRSPFGGPGRR